MKLLTIGNIGRSRVSYFYDIVNAISKQQHLRNLLKSIWPLYVPVLLRSN